MTDAILRLPEVAKRIGLSRSTIWQYARQGKFPKPVKLGVRAVGWRESELNDWIESRACPSTADRRAT